MRKQLPQRHNITSSATPQIWYYRCIPQQGAQAAALPEPIHLLYPASLVCRSADISLDLTVVLYPVKKIHPPDSSRRNLLQMTAKEKLSHHQQPNDRTSEKDSKPGAAKRITLCVIQHVTMPSSHFPHSPHFLLQFITTITVPVWKQKQYPVI